MPDEPTLIELCNFGYARGRCARFPADAEADAVRFHGVDRAGAVRLVCILERNYAPLRHCVLDSPADAAHDTIARQAEVFLEHFMGWKALVQV